MQKTLDELIEPTLIRTSVGRIIEELFYTRKYKSFGYQTGEIIHWKLGFNNHEKFCRYYRLDDYIFHICGVPDRISIENGQLYVDELKTTVTGREGFMRKVATAQLQLYMMLTGIDKGRIFIYYKDRKELVMDREVDYNENLVRLILKRFIEIYESRQRIKQDFT